MDQMAPILLRHANTYTPDPLGRQDLLIQGGQITRIDTSLGQLPSWLPHEEMDLSGLMVVPGFMDAHVHLTGGGGEAGPETRVPPVAFSQLTQAGVTTCVGVLGTDGTTRTMRDLVASTLGMRRLGLSAYCYTGSYQYPVPTLTGSVRDDIVFVDPIIGVGELAISDHRSSQLTLAEFLRVASDAYTAGLMSAKAGILHIHMGDGARGFELIEQAIATAEIPKRVYHPTHVNRRRELFEDAMRLSDTGVTVDVTAFPDADEGLLASEAIDRWIHAGKDISRVTCSSDGGGCLPVFDGDGEMLRMDVGRSNVLGQTLVELLAMGHELAQILPVFTRNVARVIRMPSKGQLVAGADADLVVLEPSGKIRHVMCGGRWVVRDGTVLTRGAFEHI